MRFFVQINHVRFVKCFWLFVNLWGFLFDRQHQGTNLPVGVEAVGKTREIFLIVFSNPSAQ